MCIVESALFIGGSAGQAVTTIGWSRWSLPIGPAQAGCLVTHWREFDLPHSAPPVEGRSMFDRQEDGPMSG
jgi:hypothetical protein